MTQPDEEFVRLPKSYADRLEREAEQARRAFPVESHVAALPHYLGHERTQTRSVTLPLGAWVWLEYLAARDGVDHDTKLRELVIAGTRAE